MHSGIHPIITGYNFAMLLYTFLFCPTPLPSFILGFIPAQKVSMSVFSIQLLNYLLTYSMEQSLYWEANRFSASQEIPRHLSLSWATLIQSIPPNPTSGRSILILSSHLRLGLPSGLFPSDFPTKTLYTPVLPHTCYIHRPSHFSRFNHPNNIGWGLQFIKLHLRNFLLSPFTSSLRTKCSSQHPILEQPQPTFLHRCERQSFTPIQNKSQVIVQCILIFRFLNFSAFFTIPIFGLHHFSNIDIITTNTLNSLRHKQLVGLPPGVWPKCNNCLLYKWRWRTNPRGHVARCHILLYFGVLLMVIPEGKPHHFSRTWLSICHV
jgi:hypothetical protein